MATVTIITDDLTGLPGAETRRFEFQGNTYDIDLTDFGFDDMAQAFHYVNDILAAARPVHPSLVAPAEAPAPKKAKRPTPHLIHPRTPAEREARNVEIQELYAEGDYSYRGLGRLYNLGGQSIANIVKFGKNQPYAS